MTSSVFGEKNSFSCLLPPKSVFYMSPQVGYTCFVQDLFPGLDKLSPRSIKCVFVGYSRTQKRYQCYNSYTRKYFVSADFMFFEFVLYFSSLVSGTASASVPLPLSVSLPAPASLDSLLVPPEDTSEPNASTPVQALVKYFRIVYTHRQKVLTSASFPVNPSTVDGSPVQPSAPPTDLEILITLRKGKQSCTDHPISNFVSHNHLNPQFRQFTLSLSSEFIPNSCEEALLVPA